MIDIEEIKRIGAMEAIDKQIRNLLWAIREASDESAECFKLPFDRLPSNMVLIEGKISEIRQLYTELQHLRSTAPEGSK